MVFEGRRGYARLALQTGVPVVPVATIGSHWTYPMLPGGDVVASVTRRFIRGVRHPIPYGLVPVAVAGIAWALGAAHYGWVVAALATLVVPLPARVTSEFLEPVDLDGVEDVEEAHRRIRRRAEIWHSVCRWSSCCFGS